MKVTLQETSFRTKEYGTFGGRFSMVVIPGKLLNQKTY